MKVKFILPALTEARSPFWRSLKYSLFPPLGLATLAGYLNHDDEVVIEDEHVQTLKFDDEPDLVAIQVYITSAYRAYEIADHYRSRGIYVVMGGLHPTALPDEAAAHADTLILGPGEESWPAFLKDYRNKSPENRYRSTKRTLHGTPLPRRDLLNQNKYLAPNSIVVSRGCSHSCNFCYKTDFYKGGKSFYTHKVDEVLMDIATMPARHLFFLDDHLFADEKFASALFDGMKGMGKIWQAAGTIEAVMKPGLLERAVASGLRSLFIGFETLSSVNLEKYNKFHNLNRDYDVAIRQLHDNGVMINGSFIFGMDNDKSDVFQQTVDWAVSKGVETATFHILTPYPGTELYGRMKKAGRLLTDNWSLYDTRHTVFLPTHMTPEQLEQGYWQSYKDFYDWASILKSANVKKELAGKMRSFAYSAGWKKFEPFWNVIVKTGALSYMRPGLERLLNAARDLRKEHHSCRRESTDMIGLQ